ncbi:MAG: cardiolipin synthase [Bacteroidales bacterium]|nr:cardiolipin synthase [Bacteroidales bacterium]
MPVWLNIFFAVLLLSIIVMEIAENGHPIRTLAWILVLTFLPGVGLLLYFFFGRDRKNRRLVSVEDQEHLQANSARACEGHIREEVAPEHRNLVTLLYTAGHSLPVEGNDVRVYTDFPSMYGDLLADLETARHHIHFQFFKFEDDELGRKAEEILTRKAQEGVEVRLQIDDLANLTRRKFYRRMQKKGVQVKSFLRVRLLLLNSDTNYRNHRKNVVIDGRVGYTGGMNIAKRYAVGIRSGIWRDTHIRVTGPVVSEMQSAFLMDWKFTTKQLLDDPAYYPAVPPAGNLLMQVATSGPMGEFRVIMQAVLRILAESKRYVYIQTPYFIPTEPIMLALRNAALSGVDVRLMVPYRGDGNFLVTLASRSYVKDLLAAGVKVIFYEKGFLHAKTIVADDQVVSIGSTNMDVRSFEQDFEINAFIYDSDMAVRMRDVFLEDEKDGRYIDPTQWEDRPAFVRFEESFARLFSPLL